MTERVINIPVTLQLTGVKGGGIDQAPTIFAEEFRLACTDIGLRVSEAAKEIARGHVNTGMLLNSITFALIAAGASAIGVTVGTNVEYARYREFGTIPHFVPFSMAPSLYIEAQKEWGWTKPPAKMGRALAAQSPGKAVSEGPGGMKQIQGRTKTYLSANADRLWLCPKPGGKPVWGIMVSGKATPFMWPAWEENLAWAEARLMQAAQRAANRISGGE